MQVDMTEAILTFAFFWILVITAYIIDRYNSEDSDMKIGDDDVVLKHSYVEIMRELIKEKTGEATKVSEDERNNMKRYLRETMGTDKIDEINPEDLK
jgi:hypothetical protein